MIVNDCDYCVGDEEEEWLLVLLGRLQLVHYSCKMMNKEILVRLQLIAKIFHIFFLGEKNLHDTLFKLPVASHIPRPLLLQRRHYNPLPNPIRMLRKQLIHSLVAIIRCTKK